MEVHEGRRAFHTLDGLRGAAALIVVTRHAGIIQFYFPESYLAVDLFFLLSGFVISYAYDHRLNEGSFLLRFLKTRLIRLYPLYFLGIVFGIAANFNMPDYPIGKLIAAALAGFVLLPQLPGVPVSGAMLDTPTWTLLPEIVANLVYAGLFKLMRMPVLIGLVVCGAAGIIVCRYTYGTLDGGWAYDQIPLILARLAFSFFGGVLIHRVLGDRRVNRPGLAWTCLLTTGVLLCLKLPVSLRPIYEIGLVLVAFPAVVIAGAQSETRGWSARVMRFLGVISYAIYALHQPLIQLSIRTAGALHFNLLPHRHLNLAIIMGLLVGLMWVVDAFYDAPVRRWLAKRLRPASPTAVQGVARSG